MIVSRLSTPSGQAPHPLSCLNRPSSRYAATTAERINHADLRELEIGLDMSAACLSSPWYLFYADLCLAPRHNESAFRGAFPIPPHHPPEVLGILRSEELCIELYTPKLLYFSTRDTNLQVVFEGPVWSGLLPFLERTRTRTRTGPQKTRTNTGLLQS